MHRRSPSAMVKLPRCHQIAWQKLKPLILLRFFYTYADDSTLFQRHGATGNHGVSCLHYLRRIGPPLNPIECGLDHGVGPLRSRAATHTPLSTCGKGFSGPHVLRRPRTRHSPRTERLWPSRTVHNAFLSAEDGGDALSAHDAETAPGEHAQISDAIDDVACRGLPPCCGVGQSDRSDAARGAEQCPAPLRPARWWQHWSF